MDRTPELRRVSFWVAPFFLLLITYILFHDFLSLHTQLIVSTPGEDMTNQFIWWRQFGFDELRKGHLALWNPYLFGGTPFLGGFQSALLYPPNWLFMVFPIAFSLNLSIALHVFLAGLFTYLWAHFRGFHPASCWMAAFIFMFGGAFFLHLIPGHLSNLCTMAWIPLVFLAVEGYRGDRRVGWILLGMAAFALQVFAGHIQYVYYTALTLAFYYLAEIRRIEKPFSYTFGLIVMGLGAGLLSAVQLLPGLAAAEESVRSQKLTLNILESGMMNPERLWGLFMPKFFDYWDHYWGGGMYWEGPIIISLTAFVLAILGLRFSKNHQKWFWAGLSLLFMLVSMGLTTPFFRFFCEYVPLFDHFRGAGKLNIFATFGLIVLAVFGMEKVLERKERLAPLSRGTFIGGMAMTALGLTSWILMKTGHLGIYRQFSDFAGVMTESFWTGAGTFFLLAVLAKISEKRPGFRYGFVVVVFIELFTFAHQNIPFFNYADFMKKISAIPQTLQKDPGDYRIAAGYNYAFAFRAHDVWGDDPMDLYRYAQFVAKTQNKSVQEAVLWDTFRKDLPPSLGLLRLRYVFNGSFDGLTVSRTNLKETPRFFVTDRWEVLDQPQVLDRVTRADFKPTSEVLLEEAPGISPAVGQLKSKIKVEDLTTDEIKVDADVSKPSVFVLADNYSKGWKAIALNPSAQTSYEVLPVDGFIRGVPLQKGEHHFILQYRPVAFVIGCWISWVAWFLFIGYFFVTIPLSKRP